jgi:cysteine desulfuration protein SufE
MNVVLERQAKLVEEFSRLPSWEERYKLLIERGKKLPPLPQELYDEKYKVRGCQSQVWLHAELINEKANDPASPKKVRFLGDSDALIVKGLVALLIEVYSNATPEEISSGNPNFIKDLGFEGHLSPSRANGLFAMIKQILYYATAFQALARLTNRPTN